MNNEVTVEDFDILKTIKNSNSKTQRELAEKSGYSLGKINKSIAVLRESGYIDNENNITDSAKKFINASKPKSAVILAAGFGMRMVPLNSELPKGLIEVHGEPLIERTIRHLNEAGISDIYIVVGFMKEMYDYLIDKYGVNLIVNTEYAKRNNLFSLSLATKYISDTYIVPCDIWCETNPFCGFEPYSWYMVSDLVDNESSVRVNRKRELVSVSPSQGGNAMVGISYITAADSKEICEKINLLVNDPHYDGAFWEEVLYQKNKMTVHAKIVHTENVVEINTYEQLRELDSNSNQLHSDAIKLIKQVLDCNLDDIKNITVLKKGMTNRSFLFECKGQKYIMRIPGQGTDHLIDRKQEAEVYSAIKGKGLCDDPVYINPDNGYKITLFLNNVRSCDPCNNDDLVKCMDLLRLFHQSNLRVNHEFNLFEKIDFYESLWENQPSIYKDYESTKKSVLSLRNYINKHRCKSVLTHIDAVPDNFLFYKDSDCDCEKLQLTDWEYSGMQDPHVDIAMFCIYSLYSREEVDRLINIYFDGACDDSTRIKIYCYISVCGLLWSNWCEYKRNLGVEFGEYSLRQYRFAKDYYNIVKDELNKQAIKSK